MFIYPAPQVLIIFYIVHQLIHQNNVFSTPSSLVVPVVDYMRYFYIGFHPPPETLGTYSIHLTVQVLFSFLTQIHNITCIHLYLQTIFTYSHT